MKDEALKLALEAMERYQVKRQDFDRFSDEITALQKALAEQPAQQELVAKHYVDGGHLVYPTAQRTWVGLTHEEMYMNCPSWLSQEQCKAWIHQIEAALRSKNT